MTEYEELKSVPNRDSRVMHPLPWFRGGPQGSGDYYSLVSASNKFICTFWGGDERNPKNFQWPTEQQKERHASYAMHVINYFPLIQQTIEKIYLMEEMPEEAIKAIEYLMEKIYLESMEMPSFMAGKEIA